MSNDILVYLIGGVAGIFGIILIAFFALKNKMKSKETKYVSSLVEGTKQSSFNMEIFYQKFYIVPVF